MSERIKVLVVIKGLGLGGAEKLLELAIPHLDRGRFEYQVCYLLPWKNALVSAFAQARIPTFCLDQRQPYDLRGLARLRRLLRERSIDLVHLHLPYSGVLGRAASRLGAGPAVVYTEHNLWQRYHWFTGAMNRLTFRWNDAVIAVSREVQQSIQSRYHCNGKPSLRTIPNGVNVAQLAAVPRDPAGVRAEFGLPPHHQLVLHVASFTPKKRHTDLLQAARQVVAQAPQTSFLLVGQGPLKAQVEEEARQLGLSDHLVFAGFRTDVPRLLGGSDLFVLSSQYEGLPVSVLEALAVGTPVVSTRVGGVPEVITHQESGLLVEPRNPPALAEQLLLALGQPRLRDELAARGQRLVREQFDIRAMVARTEELYQQVLAEKRRRQ